MNSRAFCEKFGQLRTQRSFLSRRDRWACVSEFVIPEKLDIATLQATTGR